MPTICARDGCFAMMKCNDACRVTGLARGTTYHTHTVPEMALVGPNWPSWLPWMPVLSWDPIHARPRLQPRRQVRDLISRERGNDITRPGRGFGFCLVRCRSPPDVDPRYSNIQCPVALAPGAAPVFSMMNGPACAHSSSSIRPPRGPFEPRASGRCCCCCCGFFRRIVRS